MADWRRFERGEGDEREFWQIRQEGIRCFLSWGREGGRPTGSTTVALDEQHARTHTEKKIRERLRKGFVEVPGPPAPAGDPDALVVDTIADAQTKPAFGLARPQYLPVDGFADVVCHANVWPDAPHGSFHHYLVLSDGGRRAVGFNVRESSHCADLVAAFLETIVTRRDLAFDGRSHHKIALARPVGPFSHALVCSPALGGAAAAYPAIRYRVATAFPIHDCEIGDADTEGFVDARIRGHGALPYSDWAREPRPVVDLRFDVQGPRAVRDRTFKVYPRFRLDDLLRDLADAAPGSWLELRGFRGAVRRLTPTDLPGAGALDRFLFEGV
ncbi:WGR domain-containing protein [Catellatospora vulcania]|uniref:WGR domain-containing protein n=1 Tax=Catellatospora vulcania TaxID=1460450 RepID=UPI0012D43CD0|nr:WGR domain-containing protein [Catellatospora vulcania]